MKLQVLQWNVLTQAFCNHKSYPEQYYDDEALDEKSRTKMILDQLQQAMDQNRVIALHEVDDKLRGKISVLADKNNYFFATQGHGYWVNWYMGSALLWPRDVYTLEQLDYLTVGNLIKNNVKDPTLPKTIFSKLLHFLLTIWLLLKSHYCGKTIDVPPDEGYLYRKAVARTNVLIHARLSRGKDSFHVWAYHMPCAYKEPRIMEYHVKEVIRAVLKSDTGHHILCMDGNFKPGSNLYNKFVDAGMASVVALANGSDPQWTNSAYSNWGGAFTDTIDYIWFCSTQNPAEDQEYDVDFEATLPEFEEQVYLPNKDFPSDHLWIAVDITIEKD